MYKSTQPILIASIPQYKGTVVDLASCLLMGTDVTFDILLL